MAGGAERNGSSGIEIAELEFNQDSRQVEVTPEEAYLGRKTRELFDTKLERVTPWLVANGGIFVLDPNKKATSLIPTALKDLEAEEKTAEQEGKESPNLKFLQSISLYELPIARLQGEHLDPLTLQALSTFGGIEHKLQDFLKHAFSQFRNVRGFVDMYSQWGKEEGSHGKAIDLTRMAIGDKTREEIDAEYDQRLTTTWEAPFVTTRQMIIYAYLQEAMTSQNYLALARRAEKDGSPTTKQILRLIAGDESFHASGYHEVVEIMHDIDPEGTKRDALAVAFNFEMPAQHLMNDPKSDALSIVKSGAFNKKMATDVIYKALKGLRFITEEEARFVADNYWGHQKEVAQRRLQIAKASEANENFEPLPKDLMESMGKNAYIV